MEETVPGQIAQGAPAPENSAVIDEERLMGDCIDCYACVRVCPTGIDIRNGTQLECVNCTACMDACDAIMLSINQPPGLIRFASENSIKNGVQLKFTRRIKAYTAVLALLMSFLGFLLVSRSDIDARLLRTSGLTYTTLPDGRISNLYNLKLVNKTYHDILVQVKLEDDKGTIQLINTGIDTIRSGEYVTRQFFVIYNREDVTNWKKEIKIGVYSGDKKVKTIRTSFMGPEVYN
jgi:cytochrome c oxidase accessory protein FixG